MVSNCVLNLQHPVRNHIVASLNPALRDCVRIFHA